MRSFEARHRPRTRRYRSGMLAAELVAMTLAAALLSVALAALLLITMSTAIILTRAGKAEPFGLHAGNVYLWCLGLFLILATTWVVVGTFGPAVLEPARH